MNIDAIFATLLGLFPQGKVWAEAPSGEILVETGLRHKWTSETANRIRNHLPGHSVSLSPSGNIRLHTGIKLADILL